MEICAKILQHRFFFSVAVAVILILVGFFAVMPRLSGLLYYFWPLFLSTTLVFVAIIVIGHISPISVEYSADKEGEALLDYVAGKPESLENY